MGAILTTVCTFLAKAAIVAGVMGLFTRCCNYMVRAFSGKEDIF